MVKFTASIKIRGVNPYVLVDKKLTEQLQAGWRKPLPVLVRINGQPAKNWHHINLVPVGDGDFYLYLNNIVRKASTTKVGDEVTVELEFDEAYRNGPAELPKWFAEALSKSPTAKQNWDKLSPSRQKEVVRYLVNLKSSEAQVRNLERAMHALSGNDARFMGRSWHEGI